MKRSVMTLLALAVAGIAWAQYAPARVELAEFTKVHAGGNLTVVDVRDERSFLNGHIPGAINVPLGEESQHASRLKAAKRPIITYCA